jgi:thiosulfate/3-mercaptopyruvate sulfurtransferase
MRSTNLLTSHELRSRLDDPAVRVVDCRHDLADPEAGPRAYAAGHIPGAVFAHVDRDLSAPVTAETGRHPLPDPDEFVAWCRRAGIGRATTVVAYDDVGGAYAARLWWLLRDHGHADVRLLDGGLPAWTATGGTLSTDMPRPMAGDFDGRPGQMPRATAKDLEANGLRILDARAPERYRGQTEPIDAKAGHIPGARNAPFTDNLNKDGTFLAARDLRRVYGTLVEAADAADVVAYCGSGVTACLAVLAMEEAGLGTARMYAGSWSHWIRDDARPVRTGPDP